jgi:hypothetical protein
MHSSCGHVVKSIRTKWTGHVACTGDSRSVYRILVGNLRDTDYLEHLGVDGRIILSRIFRM